MTETAPAGRGDSSFNNVGLQSSAGGVLVLLLWAFAPAILGVKFTMYRDIT